MLFQKKPKPAPYRDKRAAFQSAIQDAIVVAQQDRLKLPEIVRALEQAIVSVRMQHALAAPLD